MQIRLEMSFQEKLPRILDPQQNNKKNSRKLLYPCSFTSRNIKNKGFLGGYIFNIWWQLQRDLKQQNKILTKKKSLLSHAGEIIVTATATPKSNTAEKETPELFLQWF